MHAGITQETAQVLEEDGVADVQDVAVLAGPPECVAHVPPHPVQEYARPCPYHVARLRPSRREVARVLSRVLHHLLVLRHGHLLRPPHPSLPHDGALLPGADQPHLLQHDGQGLPRPVGVRGEGGGDARVPDQLPESPPGAPGLVPADIRQAAVAFPLDAPGHVRVRLPVAEEDHIRPQQWHDALDDDDDDDNHSERNDDDDHDDHDERDEHDDEHDDASYDDWDDDDGNDDEGDGAQLEVKGVFGS